MDVSRAVSIHDLQRLARRRLPRMAYDFIEGGCDDEVGLAASELDFRRHRLVPRYLVDVSAPDLATSVFGQTFSMPFGISPTGAAGMFRRDMDLHLAREARDANVPFLLSVAANASVEEVAAIAPDQVWLQVYGARDPGITEDFVRRGVDAGVRALVLTVDVPVDSNRERNRRNRFMHPLKVTPSMAWQALLHPGWTAEYLGNGGLPYMANWRPYARPGATASEVADLFVAQFPAPGLGWDVLETVRRLWPRRLAVKGILDPADARRAVDMGADGIVVSNHGGRQLDAAPSSVEALPRVAEAVGDRAELILDGGARRGSHLVVARALGARLVTAGRPTLYGGAAAGRAGIRRALEIYRDELRRVLGQIGRPRFDDVGPDCLWDGG